MARSTHLLGYPSCAGCAWWCRSACPAAVCPPPPPTTPTSCRACHHHYLPTTYCLWLVPRLCYSYNIRSVHRRLLAVCDMLPTTLPPCTFCLQHAERTRSTHAAFSRRAVYTRRTTRPHYLTPHCYELPPRAAGSYTFTYCPHPPVAYAVHDRLAPAALPRL